MTNSDKASRQNRATQIRVLGESLVESNEVKVRSDREGGKEGIVPDFRRKRQVLRVTSPQRLNSLRLFGKDNLWIVVQLVKRQPGCLQRQGVGRHDLRCRRQTQEADLSKPAKAATVFRRGREPVGCRLMMEMALEGECQPDVDIKKVHPIVPSALRCPRLPGFPQSGRSSTPAYPVRRFPPTVTVLAGGRAKLESPGRCARSPSPPPLRVAQRIHREPPHRFECVLRFPCPNYRTTSGIRQAIPQLRCFAL